MIDTTKEKNNLLTVAKVTGDIPLRLRKSTAWTAPIRAVP
jgi:hypothetical protein